MKPQEPQSTIQKQEKTQLHIFLTIAFALPFALGIVMGIAYYKELDISVFPSAQMYYPAAGVILAALITRKNDPLLPKPFFIGFLATTGLMVISALASVISPGIPWQIYSQYLMVLCSVVCLILLLTEKKEKRIAYGLKGGHWGMAAILVLLYLVLYFGRATISYLIAGDMQTMLAILQNPGMWNFLLVMLINYFLMITAFFGEEYGWRYYLQPLLQKRFGMVRGVLILGVLWGLWHLPINFFYYTSPSLGFVSVVGQISLCISLAAFYGWAYLKTDNIWVPVILHYANNHLIPLITGADSADILKNQQMDWGDVGFTLIINGILFLWVLFTPSFRDISRRLPTLDERAERHDTDMQESGL